MIKTIQSFAVSNKAFTNQMLGQQLIARIWQEVSPHGDSLLFDQRISGYYKYHKLTIFSTDSHLNHQIFIRKQEIVEKLIERAKNTFGVNIIIKNIVFISRGKDNDY